ncbi:RagB/SusD family nutrient uptake outer membrane protein [Arenibacter sp. F20364]|uniref:RagB/SusD family nutrient uptake outer membrane protein n=1 Tax=Arenibacter sp. F20364 TaxID=2926415 RepID=UPI001FF36340|nr:RagB/SusD family nutrient uptake outer membrane protein [Arenibacter sp. F20364]MCK0191788.1 RagB/SusD family nutrient uptake outer membrane protein [Arenibacter sp. F20364]
MKNTIKTRIGLFLMTVLLVLATGCTDFLEETDPTNITAESYFKTAEHAETAIYSIYSSLRSVRGGNYGGSPWLMLEFATGLADSDLGQADNSNIIRNLTNTSDNAYGKAYWDSSYKGIANANLAIANIPNIAMDDAKKNRLLGEARFLRAYYYYNLVRIFGSVPLITDPIDLGSENLYATPASVENIYATIEEDLTMAESSGLPFNDSTGKVTLGAVKSLLSSVYLTMAGYPLQKGNEYFQKAADKAKEVIDSDQYSLFPTYADLHDPASNNIGENIFMVQYEAFVDPSDWQPLIIPYNMNISAYSAQTGAIYANQDFIGSYEAGDKRVEEKEFYYTTYTSKFDRNETIVLGGYFLYKHFDIVANLETASSDLNWDLIRYAEVLLIYAEAQNEISGPTTETEEALNKIRRRAELPEYSGLSKEQFREAVWKEKWHELSYENVTWFDMVRLRKALNVTTGSFEDFVGHTFAYGPTLTARELLFPIPTDELRNNENLVQNPGY